jgi:hypothetical protein
MYCERLAIDKHSNSIDKAGGCANSNRKGLRVVLHNVTIEDLRQAFESGFESGFESVSPAYY